jgi:hypothetical protein
MRHIMNCSTEFPSFVVPPFIDDVPIKASIYRGIPIAMFEYERVNFDAFLCLRPATGLSIRAD